MESSPPNKNEWYRGLASLLPGVTEDEGCSVGRFWLWIDDELALHPAVAEAADLAALERVSSRGPGDELDHGCSSLLELPAILRCGEDEARRPGGDGSVRERADLEAVRLIERGDL